MATQVVFSPTDVDPDGSATATTNVNGTVKGDITVVVSAGYDDSPPVDVSGTVDLPGNCIQPLTPATTVTPTTVASTVAARPLATAAPRFTG